MRNYSTFGEISFLQKLKSMDFYLLISIVILGSISILAMYSTDISDGNFYHSFNHALRFAVFFSLMIFLSFINIKYYFSLSIIFYIFVLLLLIGATFFGTTVQGSQRWINLYFINLQPSELMKITLILFLAKYIIYSFLGLIISFPFVISILKPYQKIRILTFINPDRDPLGAGYQIIQSKIAVGSGGLTGKGFLKGTQGYLDFLPEKHTDFIFTLFSEEFGFVGSLLLLILYAFIIIRILVIGSNSRNYFGKFFCYGFAISIFFYISVNMLMVLGMLPIVGSPLPIMSYGGSSMLSMMIALGIVMSTRIYSRETVN